MVFQWQTHKQSNNQKQQKKSAHEQRDSTFSISQTNTTHIKSIICDFLHSLIAIVNELFLTTFSKKKDPPPIIITISVESFKLDNQHVPHRPNANASK